jgi:hypothetical protein
MLVELGQRHLLALRLGADPHDVAGKLADHVTARDPRRQRKHLAVGRRLVDGDADLEQVAGQVLRDNGIADGRLLFGGWLFHGLIWFQAGFKQETSV